MESRFWRKERAARSYHISVSMDVQSHKLRGKMSGAREIPNSGRNYANVSWEKLGFKEHGEEEDTVKLILSH